MEKKKQIIIGGSAVALLLLLGGVFLLINSKKSWYEAIEITRRNGRKLPTVNDKQEADELATFLKRNNLSETWTGLVYIGTYDHSKVTNIYGGKVAQYLPWFVPEGKTGPVHPNAGDKKFCIKAMLVDYPAAIQRNNGNKLAIKQSSCTGILDFVTKL